MLISLPYTNRLYFENAFASKTRNLADELTFTWDGRMFLNPSFDSWVDTEVLPERQLSLGPDREFWERLGNILPFQAEEGSWNTVGRTGNITSEVLWSVRDIGQRGAAGGNVQQARLNELQSRGVPRLGSVSGSNHSSQFTLSGVTFDNPSVGVTHQREVWGISEEIIQQRTVIEESLDVETQVNSLGERVVDVGLVPFMRERNVDVVALDLKPNARYYVYFDNVDVTANCFAADGTNTLVTDAAGEIAFTFRIPPETFNVGQRILKITDDPQNRDDFATSFATAEYTANGLTVQKESTVISTETPVITREETVERRTTNELIGAVQRDPLAYTFVVEQAGGAFLTGLELFFRRKSTTKGVFVQIRNVVNGYPGPTIVPFSEVKILPDGINVSEDGSVATSIAFDNPIYLVDGEEYAICLLPESSNTDYEVWVSELGAFDIASGQRIIEQPGAGIVFTSANNSAWSPHQQEDLKCRIFFGQFNTNVTGTAVFTNADVDYFTIDNYTNGQPVFGETVVGDQYLTLARVSGTTDLSASDSIDITSSGGTVTTTVVAATGNTIRVEYDVDVNVGDTIEYSTTDEWVVDSIVQATGRADRVRLNELFLANSNGKFRESMTLYAQESDTEFTLESINSYRINLLQPRISELLFPETTIRWQANFQGFIRDVQQNRDYRTDSPQFLLSRSAEDAANLDKSLQLTAFLSSANPNISPIVDSEKVSSIMVNYYINNAQIYDYDSAGDVYLVDETSNTGENLARYFTKPINLALSAEDLMIFMDAKLPEGTSVSVFYKIRNVDDVREMDNIEWKFINDIGPNGDFYREYFFTPETNAENRDLSDGVLQYELEGETVKGYNKYAVKIVMRSSNTSKYPKIKNLRAIALT